MIHKINEAIRLLDEFTGAATRSAPTSASSDLEPIHANGKPNPPATIPHRRCGSGDWSATMSTPKESHFLPSPDARYQDAAASSPRNHTTSNHPVTSESRDLSGVNEITKLLRKNHQASNLCVLHCDASFICASSKSPYPISALLREQRPIPQRQNMQVLSVLLRNPHLCFVAGTTTSS